VRLGKRTELAGGKKAFRRLRRRNPYRQTQAFERENHIRKKNQDEHNGGCRKEIGRKRRVALSLATRRGGRDGDKGETIPELKTKHEKEEGSDLHDRVVIVLNMGNTGEGEKNASQRRQFPWDPRAPEKCQERRRLST